MDEAIQQIERWGRAAFTSAARHPIGSEERRFIEHGAMCYFNCVMVLKTAQNASSPPLLGARSESQ